MPDDKIKSYYGPGGCMVTDRPIPGVTQEIYNEEVTSFYGSKYFIGESMAEGAVIALSSALNLEYAGRITGSADRKECVQG